MAYFRNLEDLCELFQISDTGKNILTAILFNYRSSQMVSEEDSTVLLRNGEF